MIDSLRAEFGDAFRAPTVDGATSVCGVDTAGVLEPTSPVEAAAMLSFCSRSNFHVVPVGARTWLDGGNAPASPLVMISTARFDAIDEYEPADLTITVGAGARITEVQRTVNANRQWLAQDAPALPEATIGGLVATASSGPLRMRYGTPRDHVLGLEIATGDGRLVRLGGRVVKNVAGYDLVRPIVGSCGGLGLITSVSVRLRPMHERAATLAFAVSYEHGRAAVELVTRTFPLSALELLSPWLATALLGAPAAHPDWTLLIRLHGNDGEVSQGIERLVGVLPETALALPSAISDGPHVWDQLAALEASACAALRVSAPPTHLQDTLAIAKPLADLIFAGTPMIAAHAADGVVRAWGTRKAEPISNAIAAAREKLQQLHGSVTCVQGLGPRSVPDGRKAALNHAIRRVFDPAGILVANA